MIPIPALGSLTQRLVLGCARLTGGASTAQAQALVRAALDAGITHIDTAPSYGMGTAEAVVGEALRRFGGRVQVTAKLGSARDPHGRAKSWLRRAKRALAPGGSDPWRHSQPPVPLGIAAAGPSGHDFSPGAMRASLAISQQRLGRIDVLLLHDICAEEITAPLRASLQDLAAGVGALRGYAIKGPWDSALDASFPPGSVAQCALSPLWLMGTAPPQRDNPLFLHSLVKAGAALRTGSDFRDRLDRAARIVGGRGSDADRIAALYAAAAITVPRARLIIASSHRTRLLAVLYAIARIDRTGSAAEIAAALLPYASRYAP